VLSDEPVSYDHDTYNGRNVVERSFVHLKQWRGLATRYDKLAIVNRAGAVLAAAITWLRHVGDTLGATTRWSSAPRSS
jgi:transposase